MNRRAEITFRQVCKIPATWVASQVNLAECGPRTLTWKLRDWGTISLSASAEILAWSDADCALVYS